MRTQGGLLTTRATVVINHQKITIKNTRTSTINRLRVLDQIPVSGDQRIKVSLIEPTQLEFSGRSTIGNSANTLIKSYVSGVGEKLAFPPEAKIAKGVSVRWKVADEDDPETASMEGTSGPPGLGWCARRYARVDLRDTQRKVGGLITRLGSECTFPTELGTSIGLESYTMKNG
jgi:hypothetical protein